MRRRIGTNGAIIPDLHEGIIGEDHNCSLPRSALRRIVEEDNVD